MTTTDWTRRKLLGAMAAMPAAIGASVRQGGLSSSLTLLGQTLATGQPNASARRNLSALLPYLRGSNWTFTDLEVAIKGARAGRPTRDAATLHTAGPDIIDLIKRWGVDIVATSNNHAFDLGTGGILDAIEALRRRGLAFAGTGLTLGEAGAPAIVGDGGRRLALVACATGMVRDGGRATDARPGVHELRRGADGALLPEDVRGMYDSIAHARTRADVVLAYQHNHYWEPENWRTPDWQRAFARGCIDAGASVFASHGAPLLHGVELYRGAPLFHGLSSFVFETRKAEGQYGRWNWQSVIATCRFEGSRFVGAHVVPVQLAERGEDRGWPSRARGASAQAILDRFAEQSSRLGTIIRHNGRTLHLRP